MVGTAYHLEDLQRNTILKLITAYNQFSDWLQRVLPAASGSLVALAGLFMVVEVITRYLFHASHGFMEELPRYFIICATFFIAPVMLKLEQHISVDILPTTLKGKKREVLMLIINLLTLTACVYLLIAAFGAIIYHYGAGTASFTELEIPMWIIFVSFGIGSVLLVMYAIELSIRSLLSLLRIKTIAREGGKC